MFEIYPAREESEATSGLRLGFAVDNVPETITRLVEAGAEVVSGPAMSPWGLRAVVKDLEGHRVELTEENRA